MARIGESTIEYGTKVTVHICDTCGRQFTICPVDTEGFFGSDCLAVDCPSYDDRRDISKVWSGIQKFIIREDNPEPSA